MAITTCAFDAYGTLFDVSAAARQAAQEPEFARLAECWQSLSANWRLKQLQYTWLRATANRHADFWDVTQDGLDWALEAAGLDGDAALRDRLMQLYRELDAYPEAPGVLRALKDKGLNTAILSNGSPGMLADAIRSAGLDGALDAALSVEDVGVYKPADAVYEMVGARFDCAPGEVLFVSSNCWDACAAAGFGFKSVWVNRAGEPMDRLHAKPAHVLDDLSRVPEFAA